jgi:hypothetical protein
MTIPRFLEDFRQSDDGRAILKAGFTPTGRAVVNVTRVAGERWRAMSASDKAVSEPVDDYSSMTDELSL